jgi:hypothetical protein
MNATVLAVVQQQSVLINTLVLSHQNMEIQLEKLTSELAGIREDMNSQSTLIITALSTSLKGAVQGVFGYKDSNNDNTTAECEEPDAESAKRVDDLATAAADETPLSSPPHPSASAHDQASEETSLSSNKPALEMTAFIESMQGMLQDAENKGEKDKLVELSWTPQRGNCVKGVTERMYCFSSCKKNGSTVKRSYMTWSHHHWIQRIEAITGLAWRLLRQ